MAKRRVLVSLLILSVALVGCSFQAEVNTEKPQPETAEPSAEQIMADLIGHDLIWEGRPVWKFAALSEYEEFDIRDTKTQGNTIEYDVSVRLKDFATNTHFSADAFIVYREIDGKWKLISVVTKLFERIDIGRTI